jgi:vancomycin resistance protein VanW
MYYLSLEAGLAIVERHAHTKDIYTEETRYTPLGSDATVAWGYKDFRFKNNLNLPLRFRFIVGEDSLTVDLCSPKPITVHDVTFERRNETASSVLVMTSVNGVAHTRSRYQNLKA